MTISPSHILTFLPGPPITAPPLPPPSSDITSQTVVRCRCGAGACNRRLRQAIQPALGEGGCGVPPAALATRARLVLARIRIPALSFWRFSFGQFHTVLSFDRFCHFAGANITFSRLTSTVPTIRPGNLLQDNFAAVLAARSE